MNTTGRFKQWRLVGLRRWLSFAAAGQAFGQASVITDQADYPPGSTVQISGTGFTPGEIIETNHQTQLKIMDILALACF